MPFSLFPQSISTSQYQPTEIWKSTSKREYRRARIVTNIQHGQVNEQRLTGWTCIFTFNSHTVSVSMCQNQHNQQGILALWVFSSLLSCLSWIKSLIKINCCILPLVALPILTGLAQQDIFQGEPRKDDCPLPLTLPTCRDGVKLSCYTFWKIICWKVKNDYISTHSYVSIIRELEKSLN